MKNIKYNRSYSKFNNILSVLIFSIAYYLYYLSLEICDSGVDKCGIRLNWVYKKIFQLFISSFIASILFLLILFNVISMLHIFHFIVIFIFFYLISHGITFNDHGLLNFIAFFSLFIFVIIIGSIIKVFTSFININIPSNNTEKYSFIIILIIFYFYSVDPMNCSEWGRGLNNTFIEDDLNKYGCKIQFPRKCPYNIFKHFLDFTKLKLQKDCTKKHRNSKKIIFKYSKSKYINSNTKRFGFPLTNKGLIGRLDGMDDLLLKSYVLDNLYDVDNHTINISEPELILDFTKGDLGEYIIDLKYNETLSKERKALEGKVIPYSNNLMVIFIDSVSRRNSIRQLKKTVKFIENFMPYNGGYNPKYLDEKYHSFQFFKYHSFKNNTNGNFPRIFYGNEVYSKNIVLLTKYFKENGFITNYSSDSCQKDNTRIFHNLTESEVYDHQFLLCDPNTYTYFSPYKKCLHGKSNVEYLCIYSDQFWRKYRKNRKFSVIILNDGHEPTLEALKYTDIYLYNYLNSLYEDNLLKDSTVILLSDHGVVIPSIYSLFDFYHKEKGLPMLYLIINDRKNISFDEQYCYIHENQQNFITAYDIYNTINHLLYGDKYVHIPNKTNSSDYPKSEFGQSLFMKINPKKRSNINYENLQYNLCQDI